MPIDSVFARTRAKPKPKSKRRVMRRFKLDEISAVDNPAQAGARAVLMKRRLPLHKMQIDYHHAMSDAAQLRKQGQHHRANELEQALKVHANETLKHVQHDGGPTMHAEQLVKAYLANRHLNQPVAIAKSCLGAAEAALAQESLAALEHSFHSIVGDPTLSDRQKLSMMKGSANEFLDHASEETPNLEGQLAGLLEDADIEDGEDDAEEEDDFDADDLEEMEADELEDEIIQTKASTDMNDEGEFFTEDTEVGRTANKLMGDSRISKRRAFAMAGARAFARRGAYGAAFTKASSTITTDSHEPFHQLSASRRRAEMDRRTVAARNMANAELAAMHSGAGLGREREERRRAIDGAVNKLRELDPRMRHVDALKRVRREMPNLFR